MLGVYVTVPIACFRKGLAREYLESEALPPPATCYGFLLSFVGETDRRRHIGCRVAPVALNCPQQSVVLRTVWRVKKMPLGSPGNTRPDYQQLLTGPAAEDPFIAIFIWLDSLGESKDSQTLEDRVRAAFSDPSGVSRFGGLSLGESTHLVDEVCLFSNRLTDRLQHKEARAFLVADRGRLTLPVWVDHVGSAGTRYATGNLESGPVQPPPIERMPVIAP
jgi:CRISPR-associated protein Cas5t